MVVYVLTLTAVIRHYYNSCHFFCYVIITITIFVLILIIIIIATLFFFSFLTKGYNRIEFSRMPDLNMNILDIRKYVVGKGTLPGHKIKARKTGVFHA